VRGLLLVRRGMPDGRDYAYAEAHRTPVYELGVSVETIREQRKITCDVLVVGGGIAGCFAAIKAREKGASVLLIDKGCAGKSGQSPYAGSFMVFNPAWGHDLPAWMDLVNRTSEYVNNRAWTELTITQSYDRYRDLLQWGVRFAGSSEENPTRFPAPSGVTEQLRFEEDRHGDYVQILRRQVRKSGARILDRIMLTELLKTDNRVFGGIGISVDEPVLYVISAAATVLCVGACGYKPAAYPPIVQLTGDGEAMAYRAGAEILGKEFVDTHISRVDIPVGIPNMLGRKQPVPPALAGLDGPKRGRTLYNAEGKPLPPRPEGGSKYTFTYLETEFEAHAGRAPIYTDAPDGEREMVGGACLGMSLRKADGLWPADLQGRSTLPGLFAAGDALGTMQNGSAYALTGSALANGAVSGALAGSAAAEEALRIGHATIPEEETSRAAQYVLEPLARKGGFSPQWVTQLLQNTLMPYFVSYIKRADRLEAVLSLVLYYREQLDPKLFARDLHQLRLAHETRSMLLSAEMRLRSALFRTESRGNHYREDFPCRRDPDWLAWTKIGLNNGKMELSKVPIPEIWHPDLNLPYLERYPYRFPGETEPGN